MRQFLLLLLGPLLLCLAPPGLAVQNKAKASLYTEVDGREVRASLQLQVEGGWHLYHTELGGPQATGKPLSLVWKQDGGVRWSAFRFPDPKIYRELDGGPDSWAFVHRGKLRAWAIGELADGASAEELELSLSGLTCEDKEFGVCIPYNETVTSAGEGKADTFADFPEDLVVPAAAATSGGEQNEWPAAYPDGEHAVARAFAREQGEGAELVIQLAIEEGFHAYYGPGPSDIAQGEFYGLPTTITISGGNVEWGAPVYPTPIRLEQPGLEPGDPVTPYNALEGVVLFHVSGKRTGSLDPSAIAIRIDGQTCDDKGCTLFGQSLAPEAGGDEALYQAASTPAPGAAPGGASPPTVTGNVSDLGTMPLLAFLGLAVLWGVITLLMPCTYPMIPITISFFTKQAIARNGKVLPLSLAYGAGIVAIFVLIGVLLGPGIIRFATHPVTNLVIGALFLVFAFSLFGAYELRPPAFLLSAAGRASSTGGVMGVFLLGATLVVTSFTCTAPFVGSLLSIGATGTGSTLRLALGMGVFGLTMAVPFVLLSLLPGKVQSIPKAGEWMHVLKVYLGFIEIAAALKFLSNSDLTWGWGVLSREVFLTLWTGIFAVAGFFLFGRIRLKGESETEIGPWRMSAGLGTLLLSGYCALGVLGYQLDELTTSILPNYSSRRLWGVGEAKEHAYIKDDLAAAVAQARNEQKLLLINFTGFN